MKNLNRFANTSNRMFGNCANRMFGNTAMSSVFALGTILGVSHAFGGSTYMPPAATQIAAEVDTIYSFLLYTSLISFILIMGGLFWFIYKYQRRSANDKTAYITHDHTLEFVWSFVPFVIFMFVFFWGWKVYHDMRNVPADALEIQVMAKKWDWRFTYKSGKEVRSELDANSQKLPPMLYVPTGRPVKLIMGSEKIVEGSKDPTDRPVLHSFFIPSARVKQDVVPGRYTMLWFNFDQPGEYNVFCTEYCGGGHFSMRAMIKAVPPAEFDQWLSGDASGGGVEKVLSLADKGRKVYANYACLGCHTVDGKSGTGPTFKGLWGRTESIQGGGKVTVDENYLRESILNPNAKIVAGFPAGQMPAFAGILKDDDVTAVIEFIKTLK